MTMTPADREKLTSAVRRLETPGLAIRLSNLIGKPIESGIKKLPVSARDKIQVVTEKAMKGALRAAVTSLGDGVAKPPRNRTHKLAATLTGTAGGAFGLAALAVELPLSTTIILRSIADIARAEGEDLGDPEVQLACLEVFALGGESEHDDGADVGYFAVRQGLTGITRQAAKYLGEKGLADDAAPVLLKLIAKLAARFSIPVSEKFIAQAIPVIGALGGGAVNLVFVDHFQEVAHGHFTVRRLEKIYGESAVKEEYRRIRVSGEAYL